MAKRWASSRTPLEEVEGLGVPWDADGFRVAGAVHLFEALGQGGDGDVLQAQLLEHLDGDAELALAPVDQHQVGRVGEALPGVDALLPLLQVVGEAPGEDLGHRGEVVLAVESADLEAAVVGALGQPVLHDDHGADDLRARQVGDVVALDAQRRLGQVEGVLEGGEGPGPGGCGPRPA
jgi:hypothetical protein